MRLFFVALLLGGLSGCAAAEPMVVGQPVVHLRRVPRTAPAPAAQDPHQETQLLYGETVRVVARDGDWVQVEALEQAEYTHANRWQGYPGWVPERALRAAPARRAPTIVVTAKWAPAWHDAHRTQPAALRLPLGAHLHGVDFGGTLWRVELADGGFLWLRGADVRSLAAAAQWPAAEVRRAVLDAAAQFLGDPYFWGGRSPHGPDAGGVATGVDCSGLVNLAYRTVGLAVPRDAHEQFLRAVPVRTPRPADLIFLAAREDPSRIVHVMLYAGDDWLIEGPGTGRRVHRVRVPDRLGRSIAQLAPGDAADGQRIAFGTYLP